MNTVSVLRAAAILVVACAITTIAGCGTAPTEPATRQVHASAAPRHDGDPPPPDTPCRSGWMMVDGFWTCDVI